MHPSPREGDSPTKGKAFKCLAELYAPYESPLSQATDKSRRNHGEPTLFNIHDGK
jgi:N-formylglutamate amidohydrolase